MVLYVLAFKLMMLQERHIARKKLAMLLATKPPLQRSIKHYLALFQGEEVEERGIEGELINLECRNYSESCIIC